MQEQTRGHSAKPGGSLAVSVPWGAARAVCPVPLAQGLTHMVLPALPRPEERCPGPDHCHVSLQIVLLSWTVWSCAFVGLAPCGLGLSWDQ